MKFYTAGHSIKKKDVHGHSTVAPVSPKELEKERNRKREKMKTKRDINKDEQNQSNK